MEYATLYVPFGMLDPGDAWLSYLDCWCHRLTGIGAARHGYKGSALSTMTLWYGNVVPPPDYLSTFDLSTAEAV